ncbi:High affinity cationic amino acid transporter 1 [Hordeum vulgare]|nr:High affinity cationic amino acid transporter 1 [Hordeum vulgare]
MESSQILDVEESGDFGVAISRSPKFIVRHTLVMEHGASDVAVLPSFATIKQVMPVSGMAAELGVLAPTSNPDALFAKDLCDLLASVEVVRPGLGRSFACLLTGTSIRDKQKKCLDSFVAEKWELWWNGPDDNINGQQMAEFCRGSYMTSYDLCDMGWIDDRHYQKCD